MSYNDGHIRVRCYARERNLRTCILQRHRGSTPSVMVWGAIGYNMRSRLLRIEGNLNSNRYIREDYSPRYCHSFRQLHMLYFSRTMPGHMWQGLCKPSFKDNGYHCFPVLHVRQTCSMGDMSGSSSTYSWRFVDSHTNCVEGYSPERHPGPFWFHATTHRDSDCSAWRLTPYWNHMLTDHVQFCNCT